MKNKNKNKVMKIERNEKKEKVSFRRITKRRRRRQQSYDDDDDDDDTIWSFWLKSEKKPLEVSKEKKKKGQGNR